MDHVLISPAANDDLRWWIHHLKEWNGTSWVQSPTEMDVFTDASDKGWGIVIGEQTGSGTWSQQEQLQHINWKELQTVFLAVTLPQTQGRMINLVCDNKTTIAYVNKFGGTRSPVLMQLADRIWRHCLETGTRLITTYVPSVFNPADAPSRRLQEQLEWSLDPTFFNFLDQLWGPHKVDMFAAHNNHQLPQFISWKPHPQALTYDAMRHKWASLGNMYLCPPWNLIPRIIQKLRQERLEATLIAPYWPSAPWFPMVKEMALCQPIPIPRDQVHPPPGSARNILERNPHWSLSAWRLSGR